MGYTQIENLRVFKICGFLWQRVGSRLSCHRKSLKEAMKGLLLQFSLFLLFVQ